MDKKSMTVNELSAILQKVMDAGYGGMEFCIGDDAVCEDDYVVRFIDNKFSIRGNLYNMTDYEKVRKFNKTVGKAWKELHGMED